MHVNLQDYLSSSHTCAIGPDLIDRSVSLKTGSVNEGWRDDLKWVWLYEDGGSSLQVIVWISRPARLYPGQNEAFMNANSKR